MINMGCDRYDWVLSFASCVGVARRRHRSKFPLRIMSDAPTN
ncbi:hypothetical protein [Nostoc sp.]